MADFQWDDSLGGFFDIESGGFLGLDEFLGLSELGLDPNLLDFGGIDVGETIDLGDIGQTDVGGTTPTAGSLTDLLSGQAFTDMANTSVSGITSPYATLTASTIPTTGGLGAWWEALPSPTKASLGLVGVTAAVGIASVIEQALGGDQTASAVLETAYAAATPEEVAALDSAQSTIDSLTGFALGEGGLEAQLASLLPYAGSSYLTGTDLLNTQSGYVSDLNAATFPTLTSTLPSLIGQQSDLLTNYSDLANQYATGDLSGLIEGISPLIEDLYASAYGTAGEDTLEALQARGFAADPDSLLGSTVGSNLLDPALSDIASQEAEATLNYLYTLPGLASTMIGTYNTPIQTQGAVADTLNNLNQNIVNSLGTYAQIPLTQSIDFLNSGAGLTTATTDIANAIPQDTTQTTDTTTETSLLGSLGDLGSLLGGVGGALTGTSLATSLLSGTDNNSVGGTG